MGNIQLRGMGKEDVFLAKYDATGKLIWAKSAGGKSLDEVSSIAVDASGNCYLTGMFADEAKFGEFSAKAHDGGDVFLSKIDAKGNWIWLRTAGGSDWEHGLCAQLGNDGSCYVVGEFSTRMQFENTTIVAPAVPGRGIFLAKYGSDGKLLWAQPAEMRTQGAFASSHHPAVALSSEGTLFVADGFTREYKIGTNQFTSKGGGGFFLTKVAFEP